MAMRTSGILTIGGAFVAILGGAFALLMLRAFFVYKGQGFVDLSGLVVGGVVAAVGLALVAAGRKRGRVGQQSGDPHFSQGAGSGEGRGGEKGRFRWAADHLKKKKKESR